MAEPFVLKISISLQAKPFLVHASCLRFKNQSVFEVEDDMC